MILLRVADRLIGLASLSITARLLQRDDLGLFALAASILAVIELFGQAGVDIALIQHRAADRRLYNTAWTLNILIGTVVAIALCAAAAPATGFFSAPKVGPVLYWLALASLVGGFENVGTVEFLKSIHFRRELLFRLGVRLIATLFALTLAFAWRDYWALVAGHIAGKVSVVILSFVMHPFRPHPSLAEFRSLFRFTKWVLLRNVLQDLSNHAATLVIGRTVNVGALAYFPLARTLAGIATTDLQAPIRRALFPAYAAMSDHSSDLKRTFFDSLAMMVLLGLPILVGIAMVAPDMVRVLFGQPWVAVAPLLQILALAGILSAMASGVQPLFLAMGRPETATTLAAWRLAVLVSLLALGATGAGVHGAAWGLVAAATVMGAINWVLVRRALLLSAADLWSGLHRPLVAAAIMAAAVKGVLAVLPRSDTFLVASFRLIAGMAVGAAAYPVSLMIAWRLAGRPVGAERHVMDLITGRWRPRVRDRPQGRFATQRATRFAPSRREDVDAPCHLSRMRRTGLDVVCTTAPYRHCLDQNVHSARGIFQSGSAVWAR